MSIMCFCLTLFKHTITIHTHTTCLSTPVEGSPSCSLHGFLVCFRLSSRAVADWQRLKVNLHFHSWGTTMKHCRCCYSSWWRHDDMVQGFDACFVSYAFWQLARLGRQADLVSSHGHILSTFSHRQKRNLIDGEGSGMESNHEENRHHFTTSPGKISEVL